MSASIHVYIGHDGSKQGRPLISYKYFISLASITLSQGAPFAPRYHATNAVTVDEKRSGMDGSVNEDKWNCMKSCVCEKWNGPGVSNGCRGKAPVARNSFRLAIGSDARDTESIMRY